MLRITLLLALVMCTVLSSISAAAEPAAVDVRPQRIDDVLANPNMGFADFHMGWHCEGPEMTARQCADMRKHQWPSNHPATAVTYFRWNWEQLEPEQGKIDFEYIDRRIQAANMTGQTLGFRVMAIREGGAGIPAWLREQVKGKEVDGAFWPDYRDPVFMREHRRFIAALGQRYDSHPAVDHIDIGTVGCWGEWNTACCKTSTSLIELYGPANDGERSAIADGYKQAISDYADAFSTTPLIMLAVGSDDDQRMVGVMGHALKRGTGWRVDCWGDYGIFSENWNHHKTLYPHFMRDAERVYPEFREVWKHAPIHLEVCGTIPQWKQKGWTTDAPDGKVYKAFQFAMEQHASVLNAKRTAIPDEYVPALQDLLRKNGYRYVIDLVRHPAKVEPGGALQLETTWSNLGVTPSYTQRQLAYRLRSDIESQLLSSDADVRKWLPGTWKIEEKFSLRKDLPAGKYRLEVALLDRAGKQPETDPLPPLHLGIAGRGDDGWYQISDIVVE